ncbi:toluene-4-monooxygenase system B family protein [Mycobacterium nebraskense]|uniref:toluene-4-monooxygenase system B family protein n=1 Tax=Mycobacterium nebraskense TaxID=244292 RepID=UPI0023F45895|nr:toluene-4-monooxygenase system B family protein [Mycobacterium nebraskense]MBI2692980.1 toluene monooxygenase [Mycobacterium nebraskense]
MAPLPVQGWFPGDFVVHLTMVDSDDTMDAVAAKIAVHSVNRRVPAQDLPMRVRWKGQVLPTDATPASVGVEALDCLEAFYQGSS